MPPRSSVLAATGIYRNRLFAIILTAASCSAPPADTALRISRHLTPSDVDAPVLVESHDGAQYSARWQQQVPEAPDRHRQWLIDHVGENFSLTDQTESELHFARTDSGDRYRLSIALKRSANGTTVSVVFSATPY